jgi:ParB/RepB/Spo0J family partition protein
MSDIDKGQRGAEAFQSQAEDVGERIELVLIDLIDANPRQHRRVFTHLLELADSIRERGVLVPIKVLQSAGGRYRIVYGERRWRAARDAGLLRIPCLITEAGIKDIDEISLTENEHREDLNTTDHVMAVSEFSKRGYANTDIAVLIGKSESHISKCLLAGGFLSDAMAGGFLTYVELAEMDTGLESLYLASSYAKQVEDLGFGADLLKYATSSGLTRRQMQREADRRMAALGQKAAGEEENKGGSVPGQAGAAVEGDATTGLCENLQSGEETPTPRSTVRRWQITVADNLTSGRVLRILDTVTEMLDVLSFLADADVRVGQGDKAAVTGAIGRVAQNLSAMSLRMKKLKEKTQGK